MMMNANSNSAPAVSAVNISSERVENLTSKNVSTK